MTRSTAPTRAPDPALHRLVAALVADGDHRAEQAGRRARRTLADQMPGYQRQPILHMTRPLTFHSTTPGRRPYAPPARLPRWSCE